MDLLYKIFVEPFVLMGSAPDLLIQTLWEGFVGGVLYALLALVGLAEKGVPAWLALALTIGVMFGLAVAIERAVLRPLVNQPDIILFMATFGLTYVLIGLGELIFGGNPREMITGPLLLPQGTTE